MHEVWDVLADDLLVLLGAHLAEHLLGVVSLGGAQAGVADNVGKHKPSAGTGSPSRRSSQRSAAGWRSPAASPRSWS